ncbi:intraflagellar transport protein 81 homolog [Daphnia carinata]|uniref:intraflagellar transport protein 81 homolog n=1 Tax=Daphnia carinata TaxID=120202 RepID=UPI00257DA278|nr:intraflagellar transport protein 81 homolog [Daphnia carinata]
MAQLVKLIVNELNQPPFNLNLTSVTFTAFHPPQLLQLLSDVLCEIESKIRVDIADEPVDALALRLLTALQIFKFKPETEDPNDFREGLISGRPEKINPILHWLLQRREELKKRAYLSRFLVKIDIAPEMRSDSDVIDLYEQYEFLIEEFKQRHKQFEASQIVNDTVTDLRKDLQSMEDDREVLIRRIERTQRKVEGVVNYNQLLSVAKKLRAEKEKNREFQAQKEDQKSYLGHLESRRQRLINQLTEIRQTKANTSGQMLLQRAEDAIRVNQYMINEKLNKETQLVTANIALMEKVLAAPNPTSADLQIVIQKSDDFRSKIAHLTEKRALQNDPIEDGMALYRQQSLITSRKKEACAERLNDLTQEMNTLEAQLQAKKQQLGGQSETALTSEQFKTYVSDLRVKSNVYKQRRAELNDLKAEYGILSRTLEILRAQEAALSENLDRIETHQGVKGFRETRDLLERISDEKANTDEEKGRTLEEMSNLVRILNSKISEKKVLLAPLLRELRPLRQTYQESLPEYEGKKREYEAQVQLIENTITSIANVKSELENEIVTLEERCRQLEADIKDNEAYLQRATDEMKLYVSGVQQQQTERGKSVRDQLHQKIIEQEKLNAQLRQEQRQLKDNLPQMEEQMKYWEKLEKIFRVKILCQEKQKLQEGTVRRERGRETLVLQ